MEILYTFDSWLFYAVNRGWGDSALAPILDPFFTFLTTIEYLYVPLCIVLLNLLIAYKPFGTALSSQQQWRARWCAIAMILTIALADPLNARVIKEIFKRPRPCQTLGEVRQLFPCGGGKSFPSGHATNTFAVAMVVMLFYRRVGQYVMVWAFFVSLSRVYGGVHYPSDITGGAISGALMAWGVVALLATLIRNKKYSWQYDR